MKQKTIAIVHYNTPELTEAAILSVRKHCLGNYQVVVFDNSDARPFTKKMKGVKVYNNRKGQLVDFDAELAKYPNYEVKMGAKSNNGSMKHMMSVQKLWELVPDGFILLESDVLLKKSIDFLWDERFAATGKVRHFQRVGRIEKDRLEPFLCYLNVPLLTKHGARYYDPQRCWNLQPGMNNEGNWWDTGACVLDDIRKTKPELVCLVYPYLDQYFLHYRGGSWRQSDAEHQKQWVSDHKDLWEIHENKDAKIIVCAHTDFKPITTHPVYEIMDIRDFGDREGDVPGSFYSELLHMKRVSERKTHPKYIGFCHYRRYFGFLNAVPDIAQTIAEHGAITTKAEDLRMPMREQYKSWGNVEDLDICTTIINKKYKDFAPAWNKSLQSHFMHLGTLFILKWEDFLELLDIMWTVANDYLKQIGGDIDKRVKAKAKAYHLAENGLALERRVGGQFGERIASAWVSWKFPNAAEYRLHVSQDKIMPKEE